MKNKKPPYNAQAVFIDNIVQEDDKSLCQKFQNQIRLDTVNLSMDIQKHIQSCAQCRKEYIYMQRIENAVRTIPKQDVPKIIQQSIWVNLRNHHIRPLFRLWAYIAPIFFFLFTPLIISYLRQKNLVAISESWFLFFSAFFTLWGVALIITLSVQILQQHRDLIKKLELNLDYHLSQLRR